MHDYLNLGLKNQFFTVLFYVSQGYNRVLRKFQKIVIFGQNCGVFLQKKKKSKKKFGSNCSSFILQLNSEKRINIRAVYNEIHVFKLFLIGIFMVAILSTF